MLFVKNLMNQGIKQIYSCSLMNNYFFAWSALIKSSILSTIWNKVQIIIHVAIYDLTFMMFVNNIQDYFKILQNHT